MFTTTIDPVRHFASLAAPILPDKKLFLDPRLMDEIAKTLDEVQAQAHRERCCELEAYYAASLMMLQAGNGHEHHHAS